jgi:hypothetical protein
MPRIVENIQNAEDQEAQKKPQLYSPIHLSQVTLNHKTHDHKANDKTIAAAINVTIGKLQKSKQF